MSNEVNHSDEDKADESSCLLAQHHLNSDDEGSLRVSFSERLPMSLYAFLATVFALTMLLLFSGGLGNRTESVSYNTMVTQTLDKKQHVENPITKIIGSGAHADAAKKLFEAAKCTSVDLKEESGNSGAVLRWTGEYGGNIKPAGPLSGKRIGVIVANQFNDYQVYYLASYIGEYGGTLEFLTIGNSIRGLWGIPVTPIPVMSNGNKAQKYKSLTDATVEDYDALIIVGGHSPDNFVSKDEAIHFIQDAAKNGVVIGSIAEGALPLVAAGVIKGQKCTGNRLVEYMLREIADFQVSSSVVTDDSGLLITARDTVDTPEFVQTLCRLYDPLFQDVWRGSLKHREVVIVAGEDYEDIELAVPVMELLHRGAQITIATFNSRYSVKPPHFSSDYVVGNYGTTIPFQEIPIDEYKTSRVDELSPHEFDIVLIPGGYNPQHMLYSEFTMKWVRKFRKAGKPIAAFCHGPIVLAAEDMVKGKKITGVKDVGTPVAVMGGNFVHEDSAIIDGTIITGRAPPDLPEWLDAISIALLAKMDGKYS